MDTLHQYNDMDLNENLQKIPLEVLKERCADETSLFWKRKDSVSDFCFELFRRAILLGDQDVWEFIYTQYEPQVKGWVKIHQGFASTGESVGYFVNRAFEKFWKRKFTAIEFSHFPNLQTLLSYLKSCVFTVITDYLRTLEANNLIAIEDHSPVMADSSSLSIENTVSEQIEGETLWGLLCDKTKDERELVILSDSFIYGLKPREIYTRYPAMFGSIDEVYRIKENLLTRFRRDEELIRFYGEYTGELE